MSTLLDHALRAELIRRGLIRPATPAALAAIAAGASPLTSWQERWAYLPVAGRGFHRWPDRLAPDDDVDDDDGFFERATRHGVGKRGQRG